MLNISHNNVNKKVKIESYSAYQKARRDDLYRYFNHFLRVFTIILIVILFLPWTQNVTGRGYVTTLQLEQRPQTIQSPIPGRIEKWFVREGDFVEKGDTILRLSEIKSEYLDPQLLKRTQDQRNAKSQSLSSYALKAEALQNQVLALMNEREIKIEQAKNKIEQSRYKVISDSTDLEALKINLQIAERQLERVQILQKEGLKAITEVEEKKLKQQELNAKAISQENKLLTSRNELLNAKSELSRLRAEYADKIAKAQSEKASAESAKFETEADVAKLDNQAANYEIRNSFYFITAPQTGYLNTAIKAGIGETIKEGDRLVKIMPADFDFAVESYIEPIDLPLIHVGESVRLQFDGWPAIFFSGWPNASYGTFAGKIVAVETFISENGKFRVLIAPDPEGNNWPENMRVGSGAYTMALLNDVPIWFELWRKLNGFPPNYYEPGNDISKSALK